MCSEVVELFIGRIVPDLALREQARSTLDSVYTKPMWERLQRNLGLRA
jgi:hypothetical protein